MFEAINEGRWATNVGPSLSGEEAAEYLHIWPTITTVQLDDQHADPHRLVLGEGRRFLGQVGLRGQVCNSRGVTHCDIHVALPDPAQVPLLRMACDHEPLLVIGPVSTERTTAPRRLPFLRSTRGDD